MKSKEILSKNIAQGSLEKVLIEEDFYILKIQNETSVNQKVMRHIDRTFIQFHFCLKGQAKFIFNDGNYALEIPEESSLLLYNTHLGFTIKPGIESKFVAYLCYNDTSKISYPI